MERPNETYLGDGLYASFDGWQICLRAPRGDGDHEVFLDPQTLHALIIFNAKVKGLSDVHQS